MAVWHHLLGRIRPPTFDRVVLAVGDRRAAPLQLEREKITMLFKQTKSKMSIAALIAAATLVIAPYADAATQSGSTTVSCDGSTVKSLVQVNKQSSGTYAIKINSATQSSTTNLSATSQNGNSLSWKSSSQGQTSTWTGVKAGTYTGKAKRVGSKNCNGIGLGHGNYTIGYTVTY